MHNQTPGPGHDVPYPASGTNERAKPSSPPHAGKSFWIRDYGNYTANPDLAADLRCDILVIGGGIAGLSSAWHCAKDGLGSVVVIESEIIGFGASEPLAGSCHSLA